MTSAMSTLETVTSRPSTVTITFSAPSPLPPSSLDNATTALVTEPASGSDADVIEFDVPKYHWTSPVDTADVPYRAHQGEGSQYLRDFILGVNDGIISTFLVVVGVAAGGSSRTVCLLTAISTAIAGAFAMGIGEYIATKSQLQVTQSELDLEQDHFKYHRDVELLQLRSFLSSVKLDGDLLEAVVAEVGSNDDALMKMMAAFEFGTASEDLERNPLTAMLMSARLFLIGAVPTVVPFFFPLQPLNDLAIAAALVGVALFIVGAWKTRTTKGNPWYDGAENLSMGAVATGISYAVGAAFAAIVSATS